MLRIQFAPAAQPGPVHGFRVALAADHDSWAVQTHAANFRGLSAQLDLSDPATEQRLVQLLQQVEPVALFDTAGLAYASGHRST